MDNRIVVKVNNSKVRIDHSPSAVSCLNFATEYTSTTLKIDKKQTNIQKRKVYTSETHSGWYYEYGPDGSYLTLPRGMVRYLPDDSFRIEDTSVETLVIPEMTDEEISTSLDNYTLRDDQTPCVRSCLENKRGIIQAATGAGKSIMMLAVCKIIIKNNPHARILIIEPYAHLIEMMRNYLHEECIDEYVDVSTSTSNKVKSKENLLKYNVLMMDECQHSSARTWYDIGMGCENAEFTLGFSAKVIDESRISKDIKLSKFTYSEAIAIGILGPVLEIRTPGEYIEAGVLSTPILMALDFTHDKKLEMEFDWHKCIQHGLMNADRSAAMAIAASMFAKYDRRILILVLTKIQGYDIAEWIMKVNPDLTVGLSYGGGQGKLLTSNGWVDENSHAVLDAFKGKAFNILIGTSHMDEGADIPELDVCVIAGGGKNSRRLIQKVGRALRLSKTGKYAYIIDCEDKGSAVLNKQFRHRLTVYTSDIGMDLARIKRSVPISTIEKMFRKLEGM